MIEEFPFTTRVLQAEKDINSLKSFIAQAVREAKERLASQTWARLTWEQRVTLSTRIAASIDSKPTDAKAKYYLASKTYKQESIVCETLSQMQFDTLACGTQYPTKHVYHLHCNENCCYCDIEF